MTTESGKGANPATDPVLVGRAMTLGAFIDEVAAAHGPNTAIATPDRSLTFSEVAGEVREVARGLVAAGVVKGAKVAVLLPNGPEWVAAVFGAATIGAVAVPVNTYGTAEEIDYILRHSDASVLLMQPSLLKHKYRDDLVDRFPEIAETTPPELRLAELPNLRRIFVLGAADARGALETWDDLLTGGRSVPEGFEQACAKQVTPSDDAMIIYTSGTTALPKAVLHAQRALCAQSWRWADQLGLEPTDRVWSAFPFFWTAGASMALGGTLAAGAALLTQAVFDPGKVLALMEREAATTVHAWPHLEQQLIEHEDFADRDLSSLWRVMGSSPLRKALGIEGDWDPSAAFGLTETFTINTSIPSDAPEHLRRTTHGRPLPGMLLRVVDPATGERLDPGDVGEIVVKGITLMKGYHKMLPEEYLDDEGFFHTKDSGFLDEDGYLHWFGRMDNLIKTAGANVSPVEIETALAKWGRTKTGVAFGVPHPALGTAVVLTAVPKDNDLDEEAIVAYLKSKLASYKVPRRVLLVAEEDLTFTGSQKVNLPDLRKLVMARIADGDDEWASYLRASEPKRGQT